MSPFGINLILDVATLANQKFTDPQEGFMQSHSELFAKDLHEWELTGLGHAFFNALQAMPTPKTEYTVKMDWSKP